MKQSIKDISTCASTQTNALTHTLSFSIFWLLSQITLNRVDWKLDTKFIIIGPISLKYWFKVASNRPKKGKSSNFVRWTPNNVWVKKKNGLRIWASYLNMENEMNYWKWTNFDEATTISSWTDCTEINGSLIDSFFSECWRPRGNILLKLFSITNQHGRDFLRIISKWRNIQIQKNKFQTISYLGSSLDSVDWESLFFSLSSEDLSFVSSEWVVGR